MALENFHQDLSQKHTSKSTFLSEIQFCLTFLAVFGFRTTYMHQNTSVRLGIAYLNAYPFQKWMNIFE